MLTDRLPAVTRVRVAQLLSYEDQKGPDGTVATADIGDLHDAKYIKGTGAPNPMSGYTGHVRILTNALPHAGLTRDAHVPYAQPFRRQRRHTDLVLPFSRVRQMPRAREVIASSFYGPTAGPSYHGPAMEPDPMGFVLPSSPNKVADCP